LLLVDGEYRSSFYILIKGEEKLSPVLKEVNGLSADIGIFRAEVSDRRYFGRPVPSIRVTLRSPEMAVRAVRQLEKIPGVEAILEDDLRYTTAYLLDSG
ncbi:MAG: DNA polymerase II, partial [Brevinematales bacterium]